DHIAGACFIVKNCEAVVARDDVARAGAVAADEAIAGALAEVDAVVSVGQSVQPGGIRADVIALDDHDVRPPNIYANTVAGDDMPRRRAWAADGVVVGPDRDAIAGIPQGGVPGNVRTYAVAHDLVGRAEQLNAVMVVQLPVIAGITVRGNDVT